MASGFFDFSGDSPWGGCLEDEDNPGGVPSSGPAAGNLQIDPSIDLDCIFDDDALLDGLDQDAGLNADGSLGAAIDDQWSKLTSMYLDLTGGEEEDEAAPRQLKNPAAAAPRAVIPALPSATFFSPTKAATTTTTSAQVEKLWNSLPSPLPNLPPGFEGADLGQAADQQQQQQRTAHLLGLLSNSQPSHGAISVDQLEQRLQAAPAAVPAPSSSSSSSVVLTLDDIESKIFATSSTASPSPSFRQSPPPDGQAISLEELEARLIRPQQSIEQQPLTPQFVPVPASDSRTIVEEEDEQEAVDLPTQFAQLPYYSRVEVDREYMRAADMNFILKMQRVQLANLPNLYADDFYFQNSTRSRESQTEGATGGESVLLVDHVPLCQLALPPLPPKAPADFSGVLGKIPPSSLRGPREVLQLSASLADQLQQLQLQQQQQTTNQPQQLPSLPVLPRNLGAFTKYSTLMVLENALSLVIEVEDLDILLAKPSLSADKHRKLSVKRATRTQRIFKMLRIYSPQPQELPSPSPASASSGFCFREDALFFQLLSRAKGRGLAARALAVLPIREFVPMILALVRNWDHVLRLSQNTDGPTRLLENRLIAKIQALPLSWLAYILQVFLSSVYSRFAYLASHPLSSRLFSALLKRATDIHAKETAGGTSNNTNTPAQWQAFARGYSQLFVSTCMAVGQVIGDPRKTPGEHWDFLATLVESAHPPQKGELLNLISSCVGLEILKEPPTGLARIFAAYAPASATHV